MAVFWAIIELPTGVIINKRVTSDLPLEQVAGSFAEDIVAQKALYFADEGIVTSILPMPGMVVSIVSEAKFTELQRASAQAQMAAAAARAGLALPGGVPLKGR